MAQRTRIERFRTARKDPGLAVLEGFHAVKHALRFGAELVEICCSDEADLRLLCAQLACELTDQLERLVEVVPVAEFADLAPRPPRTGILAIARRPSVDLGGLLTDPSNRPVVLLENSSQHGNIGAVVRVAAAANAAGVVSLGGVDPWHPSALRGAAGLHFALPVVRCTELPKHDRPLIAWTPEGDQLTGPTASRALLAFGTEREGLSEAVLRAADQRLSLPMRPGVSSLNLATSVAAVLYGGLVTAR